MRTIVVGLSLLFLMNPVIAQDGAEVKTLIDQVVKAAGGEAKAAKLKNTTAKAKLSIQQGGMEIGILFQVSMQDFDKLRLEGEATANGQTMSGTLVLNGDKAWTKDNNGTRPFPKEVHTFFVNAISALRATQLLPHLKGDAFKLNHLGETNLGEQTAVGIAVARKDRPDINIFFDKKTNLPIKSEVRVTDPMNQEITLEYHFSEYRDFDGLRHPSRITIKGVGGVDVVMEITELQTPDTFDGSLFAEPN